MIDTHAHIHDRAFDLDRTEMLARAASAGISRIITIGCDLNDTENALRTAQEFGLYATAGVHPHEAKDAPADLAARFRALVERAPEKIVALGETGLDFHYNHSPSGAQHAVLVTQLELAKELELPVVFHVREAFEEFVAVLRSHYDRSMRGVVHCFTGDTREAKTYVDEFGLMLGIGGVVTFKTAQPLRDAVRAVGLDAIVLETDCPYLAPIPQRGKRNEPAFLAHTAQAVAQLLDRTVTEIETAADANARAIFRLR